MWAWIIPNMGTDPGQLIIIKHPQRCRYQAIVGPSMSVCIGLKNTKEWICHFLYIKEYMALELLGIYISPTSMYTHEEHSDLDIGEVNLATPYLEFQSKVCSIVERYITSSHSSPVSWAPQRFTPVSHNASVTASKRSHAPQSASLYHGLTP